MTPSGWHDDARIRDAGHDEMQIAVWKFLDAKQDRTFRWKPRYGDTVVSARESIDFEAAFVRDGRVVCFADVLEVFSLPRKAEISRTETLYVAYEIKPLIASVGALVRQCKALAAAIEGWQPRLAWGGDTPRHSVFVRPVIKHGDPKEAMLRQVLGGDVLSWTGETLI